MQISSDTWLSTIMDREVLRVDATDADTHVREHLTTDARSRRRAFYFAKVGCDRIGTVRQLSLSGFFVVDVNVTFVLSRKPETGAFSSNVVIRESLPEDGSGVLDVAGSCFRYTRFHLDPLVPSELAHRIKREWIANYVARKRGDKLFAALLDGRPAGFLASLLSGPPGNEVATIDLVGVDANCQRQNIGRSLVEAFVQHYRNCRVLKVGTQVANVPSTRLYEKLGFSLTNSQYVMHMHVRDGKVEG